MKHYISSSRFVILALATLLCLAANAQNENRIRPGKKPSSSQTTTNKTYIYISDSTKVERRVSAENNSMRFNVQTNASSWSVGSAPSWCIATRSGSQLIVSVQESKQTESRTGDITVVAYGRKATLTITQAAAKPKSTLAVDGHLLDFTFNCDNPLGCATRSVSVESNEKWHLWGVPDWIQITDQTTNSFDIKFTPCDDKNGRTDYFKVVAGSKEIRINVHQDGVSQSTNLNNNGTTKKKTLSSSISKFLAKSQSHIHDDFHLGLMLAGYTNYKLINANGWDGEEVWNTPNKRIGGYQLGFLLQACPIGKQLAFGYQTGLYYSYMHSSRDYYKNFTPNDIGFYFDSYREHMFTMPLHAYARLNLPVDNLSLTAHTGLDISYWFGAKYKDSNENYADFSPEYDYGDSRKHWNFGWAFGIGLQYNMAHLDFIWTFGMTDHEFGAWFSDPTTYLNQFTLHLTLLFGED